MGLGRFLSALDPVWFLFGCCYLTRKILTIMLAYRDFFWRFRRRKSSIKSAAVRLLIISSMKMNYETLRFRLIAGKQYEATKRQRMGGKKTYTAPPKRLSANE